MKRSKPPPNALHTLTNTTSTITSSLLSHLQTIPTASQFPIPSPPASGSRSLILHLPMRRVTLPEMQRLKRQYESVQTKAVATNSRAAEVWTEEGIARGYVAFLETAWDTDT
jgi:protein KTI12